jgi:hypothetical protein
VNRFGAGAAIVVAFVAVVSSSCAGLGSGPLFRQYEYEEEMYLSLDGSATMYVNSSILALNALRGTSFDERSNARVDTNAIRAFFNSPVTRVARVSTSRRGNRRFVHVRMTVSDIRQLPSAAPFAWSTYSLRDGGDVVEYKQTVAEGPHRVHDSRPSAVRWTGNELVAFRIHIPSVITHHDNAAELRRGNILAWEQPLAERLQGVPLTLEVKMEPQSILYTTLFLFAGTIGAAGAMFAFVVWRLVRRGRRTSNASR